MSQGFFGVLCAKKYVLITLDAAKLGCTLKSHIKPHAEQCAAQWRIYQIGCVFCCTPTTHVIAADGLLHIQNESVINT
jgi:hypothetical protein